MLPNRFSETEQALANSNRGDEAIQGTDSDALQSRVSAIKLNYLTDPTALLLAKNPSSIPRRPPLINVGTHHRTWALDRMVERFLAGGGRGMWVGWMRGVGRGRGMGRGDRLLVWERGVIRGFGGWLYAKGATKNLTKYIEIDFPTITSPKARKISTNRTLSSALFPIESAGSPSSSSASPSASGTSNGNASAGSSSGRPIISQGGTRLDTPLYTLLPLDLRSRYTSSSTANPVASSPSESNPLSKTLLPLLDPTIPTLVLAECVLCYMQPEESRGLLEWFGRELGGGGGGCVVVVYEMCGLDDAFGTVMKRNLQARDIKIPGATFSSPQAQGQRFLDAGFEKGEGVSLLEVREWRIGREELDRISKLEMLDEVEELNLLLQHYCIAWGSIGPLEHVQP